MPNWIVNTNPQPSTADHEVHNLSAGCTHLPALEHRRALGVHDNCQSAVRKAKETYSNSDGCAYCASACHTS